MLEMRNVTSIYEDGTVALKNISIDLSKSRRIGIIGSNGAGKSTLFLNFTGVLKPKSGQILFRGKPLGYNKSSLREFRKEVGIVFQDPERQIFFSKVYDDIAFGLRNLGVSEDEIKTRVANALQSVGACEFSHKPIHFLSHGQKKRVAIAGVISMDNKIVFFDEPTAGLDPLVTKSVEDILLSLSQKQEKTVVVSSHDMDLIYNVCEYVYVLNQGEIIGEGSVKEIFLKNELLIKSGLNEPWLVKIHKNLGYPLFKNESELYDYHKKMNKK